MKTGIDERREVVLTSDSKRWGAFFVILAILVGAGAWFLINFLGDFHDVQEKIIKIENPCVDANGNAPGVIPSKGCRQLDYLLRLQCQRSPRFCRRSEKRAVAVALKDSVAE